MKRNLPPLNALRIFEAAAQTESFSQTAEMLFITQSAVSKQVRLLEEHLGLSLFSRKGGIVTLTEEGKNYYAIISQAFDTIETGSEQFYKERKKEILTINIIPSMSALWMFPRVDQFHQRHPNINLHIDSGDDEVDWNKRKVDVAIRCLPKKEGKRLKAEMLFEESLCLIASPTLLKQKPITKAEDICQHKLLGLNNRPTLWEKCYDSYQLDQPVISAELACEHFYMLIQAVLEGLGIALVPDFLCHNYIRHGRLLNPAKLQLYSDYGYYLLTPKHKQNTNKVIQFSEWIREELN